MKKFVVATIAFVALGAGHAFAGDCARFAGLSVGVNGGWAS
jgi:hypothetical protein